MTVTIGNVLLFNGNKNIDVEYWVGFKVSVLLEECIKKNDEDGRHLNSEAGIDVSWPARGREASPVRNEIYK